MTDEVTVYDTRDMDDVEVMQVAMTCINELAARRNCAPLVIVAEYMQALTVEAIEDGVLTIGESEPKLVDADGNPLI